VKFLAVKILTIDIGGTNVKILAAGQATRRRFPSGPTLTPRQMVSKVKKLVRDWEYDAISIGYPGRILSGQPAAEPRNLGPGWVGFDFSAAFGCPVKIMNDAAMQALGSYNGGTMLFIGLGTGLGATLVVNGILLSMEWGQLSYKNGTVEDYVGAQGLKKFGAKKWTRHVTRGIARMIKAFCVDDVVVGGGNAKKLKYLPQGCRLGNNANAFAGGFRMWESNSDRQLSSGPVDVVSGRSKTIPKSQVA
jgi:polyphosphate glucokinase